MWIFLCSFLGYRRETAICDCDTFWTHLWLFFANKRKPVSNKWCKISYIGKLTTGLYNLIPNHLCLSVLASLDWYIFFEIVLFCDFFCFLLLFFVFVLLLFVCFLLLLFFFCCCFFVVVVVLFVCFCFVFLLLFFCCCFLCVFFFFLFFLFSIRSYQAASLLRFYIPQRHFFLSKKGLIHS